MSIKVTLDEVTQATFKVHEDTMRLHFRALACHCECLGMNAENSFAVCIGKQIPYGDDSYITTMRKWELVDEQGNPTI